MFHPQYWANSPPMTLFERTLFEADQLFYATFPAAREAACSAACSAALEQNLYDPTSPTDGSTSYDSVQSSDYEQVPDIDSTSSAFSGTTQQLSSYPPALHFDYSRTLHSQQPPTSHHQDHHLYHYPPPVDHDNAVYYPYDQPYYHSYPSESMTWLIPPSSSSSVPARKPTPSLARPSSSTTNTGLRGTISDSYGPPESYRHDFCQLNRHMKPPTLKFTNNCQLAVMRLDRLSSSEHSRHNSSKHHHGRSNARSSNPLHVPSRQITPTPTEFLLSTPKSPSIGLSSIPSKNLPERKPPLACLFCRGRKIACGPPLPGSGRKTCNQCRKRSLQCHYPSESRRGMRKKKNPSANADASADAKPIKK